MHGAEEAAARIGVIRQDYLRNQVMVCRPPPWDPHTVIPRPWEDQDDYEVMLWLQNNGIMLGLRVIHEIIERIARRDPYHPVLDYFRFLGWGSPTTFVWDGEPRVGGGDNASWLTTYCGVADNPDVRTVGAGWLLIAVARIFDPGCPAPVLVLGGKTDLDKSAVFKILGGGFYSNDISALNIRGAQQQLRGVWIAELVELDSVRRPSNWAALLSFVSRGADPLRIGSRPLQEHKRQCVFGATTKREALPPDLTGESGCFLVRCGNVDTAALTRDRHQIWAETLMRYHRGERGEIARILAAPRQGCSSKKRPEAVLVRLYLEERCEFAPGYLIEKEALYQDHIAWREVYGLMPIPRMWFERRLKRIFPRLEHYQPGRVPLTGRLHQFYRGLQLRRG
jgi:putative DNA primase/helicase